MNNTGEKTLCVGKDKVMGNGVTIIVGAGAVLDFDHKGIFPSVKNITDEVLKLNIQKVDGVEDRFCVKLMIICWEIKPSRTIRG